MKMQDVVQSMTFTMELRGFANNTQQLYLGHIQRFSEFCGKHPASVGYDEIRAFLHHAIKVRSLSSSYVNAAYSAIKFYYQSVLCRDWNMLHVPRMKKKHYLPTILTKEQVHQILECTRNLKHQAILSTIYSAGLRVSEAAHLKVSDILTSELWWPIASLFHHSAGGNVNQCKCIRLYSMPVLGRGSLCLHRA